MDKMDLDYNTRIEQLREREYPQLKGNLVFSYAPLIMSAYISFLSDTVYLDHAGTTPYAKSLIERFSADMISNLYGNPHSASSASQLSTRRTEDVRLRLLGLFNADPDDFDIVFVANATAGIKLVMEAFRDHEGGFWYGYHRDSHTSLVGVREAAARHRCFTSDAEVEGWLSGSIIDEGSSGLGLFAYPAQSNMNGRRLALDWAGRLRCSAPKTDQAVYTLLDAAAYVSSSPLDLSNAALAPDFTVMSLYKIFGFPDLGVLIVRKGSGHVLRTRKYFGGGTVDMVLCMKEQWHARKSESLHDQLEDGTLPIHSIIALDSAMNVHQEIFGALERVSRHTAFLARNLYHGLRDLRHWNNVAVCEIYKDAESEYGDTRSQGPVIAFNIRNSQKAWVSNTELEKLAAIKNIQLRTGGLCNPGGTASSLGLAPWEMKENFSAGQRCGNETDILGGKPTGMIRVSLGAMSSIRDIEAFMDFMNEFFVDNVAPVPAAPFLGTEASAQSQYHVESLTVYPIKSCAGWRVPPDMPWEVRKEGLAWDREWCLVHQGTGTALSQKRYPRMALIRPIIDLETGLLRVRYVGDGTTRGGSPEVAVPLSADPNYFAGPDGFRTSPANVCGDKVTARVYKVQEIVTFFTEALGIPCQLARFPAVGSHGVSSRHAKAHLQQHQLRTTPRIPGAFPAAPPGEQGTIQRPILLSNESPILTISRSSLNRLNEQIKANGGKAAQAEVFRANIVVAEALQAQPGTEQPYAEDHWRYMQIGRQLFQMLGSCRRCQMVCVDQNTAVKNEEPFVTLAKTRRFDGKVWFGQHGCHVQMQDRSSPHTQNPTIKVGDPVRAFGEDDDLPHGLVS